MAEQATIDGWYVLELMGHRRLAGYVREVTVAGSGFLRVDVPLPDPDKQTLATQFYPPSSVYCMTPVTEAVARAVARSCQPEPVSRYELPAPRRYKPIDDDPIDPEFTAGMDDDRDC